MIKARFVPFLALGIFILGSAPFKASAAVNGVTITSNTPRFTETSNNKGAVSPSTVMDVSIWLKPHSKADLDAVAKEMYDPTSSNYRRWLTKAEFMLTTSSGTTSFSADALAAPLEGTTTYYSTIWNIPFYETFAVLLTFGTDSGLKTAKGWDNVAGLGVPTGQAFAEYFAPKP